MRVAEARVDTPRKLQRGLGGRRQALIRHTRSRSRADPDENDYASCNRLPGLLRQQRLGPVGDCQRVKAGGFGRIADAADQKSLKGGAPNFALLDAIISPSHRSEAIASRRRRREKEILSPRQQARDDKRGLRVCVWVGLSEPFLLLQDYFRLVVSCRRLESVQRVKKGHFGGLNKRGCWLHA